MEQIQNQKTSTFSARSLQLFLANKARIHSYLNKAIILGIVAVCLAYVGTINDLSIKGFVLDELHGRISELEMENEQRELDAMALESYDLINERARKIGMVKVDNIKYLSVTDTAVAVK
jgi:hypothetical protein